MTNDKVASDGKCTSDIYHMDECPIKMPRASSMTQASIDWYSHEDQLIEWYENFLLINIKRFKLTKYRLNEFISWTSTRYNDWLGYGTKKQNIDKVFFNLNNSIGEDFTIKCASPSGENPHRGSTKYWKTKKSGNEYYINIVEKSIINMRTKETLYFI